MFVCMCAKLLQSCPTLCDPVDGSPAGSPILFFDVRLLQSCPTCCDPMHCSPPGFSVFGDSPGKNTGVSCLALLQGIFPTQGSNLCLLYKSRALAGRFFTTSATWEDLLICLVVFNLLIFIYNVNSL